MTRLLSSCKYWDLHLFNLLTTEAHSTLNRVIKLNINLRRHFVPHVDTDLMRKHRNSSGNQEFSIREKHSFPVLTSNARSTWTRSREPRFLQRKLRKSLCHGKNTLRWSWKSLREGFRCCHEYGCVKSQDDLRECGKTRLDLNDLYILCVSVILYVKIHKNNNVLKCCTEHETDGECSNTGN